MDHGCLIDIKKHITRGVGCHVRGSPQDINFLDNLPVLVDNICNLHNRGPYGNLKDLKVLEFVGLPLVKLCTCTTTCDSYDHCNDSKLKEKPHNDEELHKESRSSMVFNKDIPFNYKIGFVTQPTSCLYTGFTRKLQAHNPQEYLQAVTDILSSGRCNHAGERIRLPSAFNWDYLEQEMLSYHDKRLLDYLQFGFPLGLMRGVKITSNAINNHQSAIDFPVEVEEYISTERKHGALLGPFDNPPHPEFTWSPLMTRPKGSGRRVILDLSYGDYSVNHATNKELYDDSPFQLTLPSLDHLLPALQQFGQDARLFKVDISRAFRNVPVDPGDAIHLGIKWGDQYYIDKFLAFGAIHGTAIFERITNFIRYILANKGVTVYNYIDDIYACCHKDQAQTAFRALTDVIRSVGLPINPSKLFPPCKTLSILGIVVDVDSATFRIEEEKLREITTLCAHSFIRDVFTKRELQRLLGKLLYVSRCIRGAHVFLNRILSTLRDVGDSVRICPDEGFYWDLQWFLQFLSKFNGVVTFNRPPVSHTAFVDASLQGLGGVWGSRVYSVAIPFTLIGDLAITQYELYNILVAVKLWAPHWKDKVVLIRCDNESAVMVCNTGRTRDAFLAACLRNLWLVAATANIDLRVKHIKGKDNILADALSRNHLHKVGDVQWEIVNTEVLSLSMCL